MTKGNRGSNVREMARSAGGLIAMALAVVIVMDHLITGSVPSMRIILLVFGSIVAGFSPSLSLESIAKLGV